MTSNAPLLLDPAGYRRTPWKNGGGVTVDIADAYRPGATIGGWEGMIWRFGRTRIEHPGPFSDLGGFDRHLAVIEGEGLLLHPAGEKSLDVRRPFQPVRFSGEWRIESELTRGPVGVLNLLADRTLAESALSFHEAPAALDLPEGIVLIHAWRGAEIETGGRCVSLQADAALRFDLPARGTARLVAGRVALAVVRLRN